ncbi:MAG: Na+ dependent nucleoside transporter N-terminal domain-containing protein, partial [Lentisphaerota bacterium]
MKERLISFIGIFILLFVAWLMSNNKRRINMRTVVVGIGIQFVLGFLLLWWSPGVKAFQWFSQLVSDFLALSNKGAAFLFGNLADSSHFFTDGSFWPGFGFQFAFLVLPTIIFFSAFMSIMYYLGIMQKVIRFLAGFMQKAMGTSGSETLSVAGNIFVGQTEAPLLIRPFLEGMTKSELLTVMVGGFATIAGGVLAGYIGMGISASHLIVASVMSAPAALVVAKIIYPETEKSVTAGNVDMPPISVGDNLIDAAARGTTDGLKLAVNVGAMLIAFISLIAFVD